MDDFVHIKQLWDSKNNWSIPNVEEIQTIIKDYQTKKKQNTLFLITLFILCGIALVLVIVFHNPLLWTTTFGEVLIAIGFILGMILKLNTLKHVTKNELKSNKDFLEDLIKLSAHRKSKVNWLQLISVLLLAIGYGFFIYEEIIENQSELILSYLGIILFALGLYFIYRPFVKSKSKKKIQKMIKEIERLK